MVKLNVELYMPHPDNRVEEAKDGNPFDHKDRFRDGKNT
jgi:hypothetical protein